MCAFHLAADQVTNHRQPCAQELLSSFFEENIIREKAPQEPFHVSIYNCGSWSDIPKKARSH